MSREGPWHSANEQMMENPKQLAMGAQDITWNEKQHILQQKEQCEDNSLEGTKGKNCYGTTFVLTGITWHRIRETKKQHCEEKNKRQI